MISASSGYNAELPQAVRPRTPWFDQRSIYLGRGDYVSPFWHCFGVQHERVSRWQALRMMLASRTWLLPINTNQDELLVGHNPTVTWERFRQYAIAASAVPCLNINHRTTVKAATGVALSAFQEAGIDLVKLEVLTDDLTDSNDEAVYYATEILVREGLRVMPLVSSREPGYMDIYADMELVPAVRVMGSYIGSGHGIVFPEAIEEFVHLADGKPIILDGGIGSVEDIVRAMSLGCAGFLVNSMLFADGRDPVETLHDIRSELLIGASTGRLSV